MKRDLAAGSLTEESAIDRNEQDQRALIAIFIKTVEHFFGSFQRIFRGITDPRDPGDITYSLASLCFAGVLMFVLRLGARRQVTYMLRENEPSRQKFEALFNVESFPHGDSINDLYVRLSTEQGQEAVTATTEDLIRKKVLYSSRLLGIYYVVAVDGAGTLTFDERHCPFCLTQVHGTKIIYYHKVLEAKIVTPNGFSFSLMTEFIENPGENPSKQDCSLSSSKEAVSSEKPSHGAWGRQRTSHSGFSKLGVTSGSPRSFSTKSVLSDSRYDSIPLERCLMFQILIPRTFINYYKQHPK